MEKRENEETWDLRRRLNLRRCEMKIPFGLTRRQGGAFFAGFCLVIAIHLAVMTWCCGLPDKSPEVPARYFSYQCAWCGYFDGSSERMTCYLEDGTYHTQDELLADPSTWFHFACCDAWWAGQYMCYNSGMCNTCLSFAADVPPQTAAGCSSSPWDEHWNVWCSAWNKACYQGNCD